MKDPLLISVTVGGWKRCLRNNWSSWNHRSKKPKWRTIKLKSRKKAPTAGNLDEPLGQKARLDEVLEGNMERQYRPYSPEELFALEQTRGFSHTPEEIGTIVQKAKDFSFPYHEPTQAGSVDVLPSYEEMTVDELFNGPTSSMETQPD